MLAKCFEVKQFNIFAQLNNALEKEEEFDIILYIISEGINQDTYFHNYLEQKKRLPVLILGNNESDRFSIYINHYGVEGCSLLSNESESVQMRLLYILDNKLTGKKSNPKARYGLTSKEVLLLRLLSSKNSKADVCQMLKLSTRQVERIRKSAFEKIGEKTDFQAGVWFTRHFLPK